MKKMGKVFLATSVLISGILLNTSGAFAMGSKGSSNMTLQTDANVYSKSATSIDVSGSTVAGNVSLELVDRYDIVIARKDVYFDVNGGSFKVSFPTRNLPTGLYDINENGGWGSRYWHRELTNYLKVNY